MSAGQTPALSRLNPQRQWVEISSGCFDGRRVFSKMQLSCPQWHPVPPWWHYCTATRNRWFWRHRAAPSTNEDVGTWTVSLLSFFVFSCSSMTTDLLTVKRSYSLFRATISDQTHTSIRKYPRSLLEWYTQVYWLAEAALCCVLCVERASFDLCLVASAYTELELLRVAWI